ncbi:MAG: transporter [marine bacterium B5-7]|nr:MAG: transporter [marine bacterium B5-7]
MPRFDLDDILRNLEPIVGDIDYVFCTLAEAGYGDYGHLEPFAAISEHESLTLIVPESKAHAAGLSYDCIYKMITLNVFSSLESVGLTAVVSAALADKGISANMVAGFHHDHLFVPSDRAADAVEILDRLWDKNSTK